jgi:hypothetical protein
MEQQSKRKSLLWRRMLAGIAGLLFFYPCVPFMFRCELCLGGTSLQWRRAAAGQLSTEYQVLSSLRIILLLPILRHE